ncbi:MAG: flagellar hook protein, partial [Burkholderiales bacterium PBB5]
SYAIHVQRLATGQTVSSTPLASSAATLSAGTLTIELGTYGSGSPAADFTNKTGSSPVTIDIGAGDTSLASIRDKINSAGAGVVATIVSDASGARLSLRSNATAADSPMARTASAVNAALSINGIALTSASNTLTDVVDGLTVNLLKTTAADVDVSVATDTATVKTAITDFVSAFNTLASFIKTQTAYNADSKTAGALQGDQSTLALQSQLRSVLNEGSSASSSWSRLSEIGLTLKADGTLDTGGAKLDNALANLPELKKLLSADSSTSAGTGFVRRFKNLADAALGTEGVFETRSAGIRASVERNSKSQD